TAGTASPFPLARNPVTTGRRNTEPAAPRANRARQACLAMRANGVSRQRHDTGWGTTTPRRSNEKAAACRGLHCAQRRPGSGREALHDGVGEAAGAALAADVRRHAVAIVRHGVAD